MARRAILMIIDSFGIGALPDAHIYDDEGANTALHICQNVEEVRWPNLKEMGLGNCSSLLDNLLPGCEPQKKPSASYGVLAEKSAGKDTTTGHWELAGIVLEQPFHTFPLEYPSFPRPLTDNFINLTGHSVLGNKGASGTVIIEELGESHMRGEGLICYTSADSVFQIAAHEKVVPIEELYRICEITRKLCDEYNVGRVIARPFTGTPGEFTRTKRRRDYSMLPPGPTILDILQNSGIETIGIGKIGDIFLEQGLTASHHDAGNDACLKRTVDCLQKGSERDQFYFINLVDTDMHFGHRRDVQGYHDAVANIDVMLPKITSAITEEDLLLISADHGCDPTFKGTDHTREYVPILVFQKDKKSSALGIRESFSDVAQSLAAFFKIHEVDFGKSFL